MNPAEATPGILVTALLHYRHLVAAISGHVEIGADYQSILRLEPEVAV
jgi:hypothetical protein